MPHFDHPDIQTRKLMFCKYLASICLTAQGLRRLKSTDDPVVGVQTFPITAQTHDQIVLPPPSPPNPPVMRAYRPTYPGAVGHVLRSRPTRPS